MAKKGELQRALLLCCVYGLAYFSLRESPTFFKLSAGLAFTALLLSDRRDWILLTLTQMAVTYLSLASKLHVAPYNWQWLALMTVGPAVGNLLAMEIARRLWPIQRLTESRDAIALLKTILLASLLVSAGGLLPLFALQIDWAKYHSSPAKAYFLYSFGFYVGSISLAPLALWVREAIDDAAAKGRSLRLTREHWLQWRPEAAAFASWCVSAVFLTYAFPDPDLVWAFRLAMFVPLAAATYSHGWKGASIYIPLINIALAVSHSEDIREPNLLLIMELSCLISSMALVCGIHITNQSRAAEIAQRAEAKFRKMAAQRAELPMAQRRAFDERLNRLYSRVQAAEQDLRRTDIDSGQSLRVYWLTVNSFRQEVRSLRESVYSPLLAQRGLSAALAAGPIPLVLEEIGATFNLSAPRTVDKLPRTTQDALYYSLHTAAFQLLAQGCPAQLTLRIRTGERDGRQWIACRATVDLRPVDVELPKFESIGLEEAIVEVTKVAQAYDGDCRCYGTPSRRSVTMLVFDEAVEQVQQGRPRLRKLGG